MPVYSRGQRGAALIMALVILLILTILGVTAMSTSSLEQKMAGNIQDLTRAFQAAESGIDRIIDNNPESFDMTSPTSSSYSFDNDKSGKTTVTPSLIQITSRSQRSSRSSGATSASTAHINLTSNGVLGNARYTVHQGVTQPAPPQ